MVASYGICTGALTFLNLDQGGAFLLMLGELVYCLRMFIYSVIPKVCVYIHACYRSAYTHVIDLHTRMLSIYTCVYIHTYVGIAICIHIHIDMNIFLLT